MRPGQSWRIGIDVACRRHGEDEASHRRDGACCCERDSRCGDLRRSDGLRRFLPAAPRFSGRLAYRRDCRDRPCERDSARRALGLQEDGQRRRTCSTALRHPDRPFHGAAPRAHRDAESCDIHRVGRHRLDQRRPVRHTHSHAVAWTSAAQLTRLAHDLQPSFAASPPIKPKHP
jgi:hypothetical protein